jgi:hypothetical protein
MTEPRYLVRLWGRDQDAVEKLRTPDAVEDEGALCYWFPTPIERAAFLETIPSACMVVRDKVDPGVDIEGESIDTRACTMARVTLRLPDGREGTFVQSFGFGYPAHGVEYMWHEGNYSCDCNKRLYLARECNIDPDNADLDADVVCGDEIQLVNLKIFYRPFEGRTH